MKNILIITDNLYLSQQSKKIFANYTEKYKFDYSISPFSSAEEFSKILSEEVLVFDLKNNVDIQKIIKKYQLVFSIHCKQLFPELLFKNVRCINVHPGYNPLNRGWYPQVFSIINDIKIGATIHEIDGEIDHGNIIAREFVEKEIVDTSKTLYDKILNKELELLSKNIDTILNDSYSVIEPEIEGIVYLKKHFNNLCELDLNEKVTAIELINKLRALTHGNFKNAYFIDPTTNKKVFVSINLKYQ